ncbi:MAG TPA: hypothetical protein VK488_12985 [Gaiellaceae bacterium]|nr:hypothetical protein [Gaiellaceae bacterium]
MSWLNDPEDASQKPWRVLAFMFVSGLGGGGAIGYFRFDRSLVWALILGVTVAVILTYYGWKSVRDPAWAQALRSRREFRKGLLRLALPFLTLVVAFLAGISTQSEQVFIVVVAVGLALSLVLRVTVWR